MFATFRDDPELRVAIITAAGERFFSAGWDSRRAADGEAGWDMGVGGFGGLQELPGLNKPVIAAVNGMAIGGGFEVAMSADLIVAAEHARSRCPRSGGQLADAATIKLPRRIPYHLAMELLMTGRWMDARRPARWAWSASGAGAGAARPRPRARPIARRGTAARLRRHQGGRPRDGPPADPGRVRPGQSKRLPRSGALQSEDRRKGRALSLRSGCRFGRAADKSPPCSRPLA